MQCNTGIQGQDAPNKQAPVCRLGWDPSADGSISQVRSSVAAATWNDNPSIQVPESFSRIGHRRSVIDIVIQVFQQ